MLWENIQVILWALGLNVYVPMYFPKWTKFKETTNYWHKNLNDDAERSIWIWSFTDCFQSKSPIWWRSSRTLYSGGNILQISAACFLVGEQPLSQINAITVCFPWGPVSMGLENNGKGVQLRPHVIPWTSPRKIYHIWFQFMSQIHEFLHVYFYSRRLVI